MPITITPVGPLNAIGPGLSVQLQSSFIGPIQSGTQWRLGLFADSDFTASAWQVSLAANSTITQFPVMTPGALAGILGVHQVADGQNIFAQSSLVEPGNAVIDTGTGTLPWNATAGLGASILSIPSSNVTGGFTETDRTQLQSIAQSTVLANSLNTLTLQALPGDPQTGFVGVNLTTPVWGILIRLTAIPEQLLPQTPDGDYWVQTLAVARLFRGSDLWLRVPVHTSSKIINIAGEAIAIAVTDFLVGSWLLDMSLQVTFLPGVSGNVFLMHVP